MCKNTHRYFSVNFLKRHLKMNGGSIIFAMLLVSLKKISKICYNMKVQNIYTYNQNENNFY